MNRLIPLLVIILLAFAVRSVFIADLFTGDAIDTVGPARNFVETGRAAVYATSAEPGILGYVEDGLYFNFTHPPMRFALYSIWAVIFGLPALSLLPILFGVLSIIFIYLIAREIFSEKVAVIAALLAAVLRYHVYASVIGFGDNLLMVFVGAMIYFFILYLRRKSYHYLLPVILFSAAGILTKLSILPVFAVLVLLAWIHRDKIKFHMSFVIVLMVFLASFIALFFSYPVVEHFTGVSLSDVDFFSIYVDTLFLASEGYQPFVQEKSFYLLSFAWQMTPFFAALLLLSLVRVEKSREYWSLVAWLVVVFLAGFASSGQDFQRFMVIAIIPAVVIVAKYVSDIDWNWNLAVVSFVAVLAAAGGLGLNDMLSHYSPEIPALFFLAAFILLFLPRNEEKRKIILVAAAAALSVYFLFGTAFIIHANSSAVSQIVDEVRDRGYPYEQLWTTRDISMYLAPYGHPSLLKRPLLNQSLSEQAVSYFAFYSVYEESKIIELSAGCIDKPFFAEVNSRKVGLVCQLSPSR